MDFLVNSIIILFVFIPMFIACLVADFLCANAAKNKGRSYGGWFCLSFFGSPFLAAILLIAMGDTEDRRIQKLREMEEIKQSFGKNDNPKSETKITHQDSATSTSNSKTINDLYKK